MHLGTFKNLESRKWRLQGFSRGIFQRRCYNMLFRQNTRNTENNAIKMSQAFHDIAQFERFTDLNLFNYTFNVIQNWKMDALQFYLMVLTFF